MVHFCMDWRSVKFDWNRAKAFLVTAQEGSLTAAARALGLTQPTLSRQVSSLEKELGVALIEHSGRGITLTASGLELLEHVRAMGDAANQLSLAASGQSQTIEGTICITTTELTAAYILPPIILKLRKFAPGIRIELIASNSVSDLKRREADIAIRYFRPTQADLIIKKVCELSGQLYATPSYLDSIGNPSTLAELKNAEFIGLSHNNTIKNTLYTIGQPLSEKNFPVFTDNRIVHWELVKQGVGITVVPEQVGDSEPLVQRVIPELQLPPSEVWLTSHRELRTSRRVRLVFDFLAQQLSQL